MTVQPTLTMTVQRNLSRTLAFLRPMVERLNNAVATSSPQLPGLIRMAEEKLRTMQAAGTLGPEYIALSRAIQRAKLGQVRVSQGEADRMHAAAKSGMVPAPVTPTGEELLRDDGVDVLILEDESAIVEVLDRTWFDILWDEDKPVYARPLVLGIGALVVGGVVVSMVLK